VTTDGNEVGLADFRGTKLVLYFYPMDFTPGCTAQACSLRDHNAEIQAKGAKILGVSTQDAASHKRFASAHHLNFPLLADPDRSVVRAYGAIGGGGNDCSRQRSDVGELGRALGNEIDAHDLGPAVLAPQ